MLSKFRADELEIIGVALEQAADAVSDWVFHGMNYAMERHNRKPEE